MVQGPMFPLLAYGINCSMAFFKHPGRSGEFLGQTLICGALKKFKKKQVLNDF